MVPNANEVDSGARRVQISKVITTVTQTIATKILEGRLDKLIVRKYNTPENRTSNCRIADTGHPIEMMQLYRAF